jgi:DNA-binding response OmpR family regulator
MKKILIIEDDPIVAHVYRSRLEKEGFEVEVAPDGQMGHHLLYQSKPDGLLLDLMLPKLNGIDLLKKIRAVREFEKIPIVVFTNAYVANMIHEAFSSGASAVYNKSTVTPRQIIDVLTNMLSSNGTAAANAAAEGAAAVATKAETAPASPDNRNPPKSRNRRCSTPRTTPIFKSNFRPASSVAVPSPSQR